MPHLRIIYDVDGWAFHRRALALERLAPRDFSISMVPTAGAPDVDTILGVEPPDILLLLAETRSIPVRRRLDELGWSTRVVTSWNTGWPSRIAHVFDAYRCADWLVFNNHGYWRQMGEPPDSSVIANGVDRDTFRVTRPPAERTPKVIWVGSEMHRENKGYDSHLLPLQRALAERGVDCELMLVDSTGPIERDAQAMAAWYNDATVYVCASAAEGTPNPALEAAACGCIVVSTAVGNMPELVREDKNGFLVERDVAALLDGVGRALEGYARLSGQMLEDIRDWDWQLRADDYFSLFRRVLERPRAQATGTMAHGLPDLSDRLTVFVATVGAPVFRTCLEHLVRQDCLFRLVVIENVAPMNRALQRMQQTCETPYYVQVDEDMLLRPHAVRTLFEAIEKSEDDVAILVRWLYDAHLRRAVYGVKVYRQTIVARFPYRSVIGCESEQLDRLAAAGYRVAFPPKLGPDGGVDESLGLHGTDWTPLSAYERYLTLQLKNRASFNSRRWLRQSKQEIYRRMLDAGSEIDFFAFMGAVTGLLRPRPGQLGEKDYRTYADLPGYAHLLAYHEQITRHERGVGRDSTVVPDAALADQTVP